MNPETRFRVPNHVFDLAQGTASELGLRSHKGKTGGASELARGALYVFLGLGLPAGLTELAARDFERVKANRPDQYDDADPHMLVTVHHRVDPEYRKQKALNDKQQIPARVTTELRFPQGDFRTSSFLTSCSRKRECPMPLSIWKALFRHESIA